MDKARTCKRLFSIVLTCALALMMLPATAFAEVSGDASVSLQSGESTIEGDGTSQTPYIVTCADEFGKALESTGADTVYIKLGTNVFADVVIPAGKTVYLDLNGCTLTNVSDHTITNNGTLTVTGTGTVDNVTNAKAAIRNNNGGTATLDGGTYTRSAEIGTSPTDGGGNSFYTICNFGVMTINSGATVYNTGHFSSMIENGFYGPSVWTEGDTSSMTINGGTFSGGINTIKNDSFGTLVINGGDFSNATQAVLLNWNVATINGGTFNVNVDGGSCLLNGTKPWEKDESGLGQLTVTDGSFSSSSDTQCVKNNCVDAAPVISGGTFSSDVSEFVETGYTCEAADNGSYKVSVIADNALVVKPGATAQGSTSAKLDGTFGSGTTNVETSGGTGAAEGSKPSGNITDNTVKVTLPDVTDATNASLSVAGATASSLASNGGSLTIDSTVGTMAVNNAALQTMSSNAGGSDVVLSIAKTNDNTYELTAKANDQDVFAESNGVVTVSVPCPSNVSGSVFVYYLGPNGAELVSGAKVVGDKVVWETNHFSTFYIASAEQTVSVTDGSGTTTYASFDEALANLSGATGNVTINLLDNVDMTTKATIDDENVTINGNGYTITGVANNASVNFEVADNGKFNINNVTLTDFGSDAGTDSGIAVIKVDSGKSDTEVVAEDVNITNFCRSAYDIRSGSFTITGGTIDSGSQASTGENSRLTKGIMVGYGSSKVTGTIDGVTITNSNSNYADWNSAAIEVYQNADVTITGCTIENVQNGISVDNYYAVSGATGTAAKAVVKDTNIDASNNAVMVFGKEGADPGTAYISVTGGTLKGEVKIQDGDADKDTVSLFGTTVIGNVTNEVGSMAIANSTITGTAPDANAEGVIYANSTVNGTLYNTTVSGDTSYVAMVNGVKYETLREAVDEAENGDTVILLKDVVLDGTGVNNNNGILTIDGSGFDKNITLDGNGKTIKAENVTVDDTSGPSMINVQYGANVTVKNLTIDGLEVVDSGETADNTKHGLNVYQASVTVENVTIKNGNGYGIVVNGSKATINGLTTFNNGWGGVNVDSKSGKAELVVNDATINETNSIKIENGSNGAQANPSVDINGGSFQYITAGPEIANPDLTISGGKFATGEYSGALDIVDYLKDGLILDSEGNVVKWPTSGGGSVPEVQKYDVAVAPAEHGKVTADPETAAKGAKVVLTVAPDEGYELSGISAEDASGEDVALAANEDGTYSFVMPASDVTVTASFAESAKPWVNPYSDVSEDDWFYADVAAMAESGIMSGYEGTDLFGPYDVTTRAMAATVIWRLAGQPEVDGAISFSDVEEGQWYTEAVRWAAAEGVTTGYDGTDLFGTNDLVTREQFAVMLYRYAQGAGLAPVDPDDLSAFPDAGEVSEWADGGVKWAVAAGILRGVDGVYLEPQGDAMRCELAAMLNRCMQAFDL